MIQIPTYSDPFYTQTVQLDGVAYLFEFRYNQREDAWYFSIALADETPLLSGIKVMCGQNLLRRGFANPLLPPGSIIACTTTTDDSPPRLNDLAEGGRVVLVYSSATS